MNKQKEQLFEGATRKLISQLDTMGLEARSRMRAKNFVLLFRDSFKLDSVKNATFSCVIGDDYRSRLFMKLRAVKHPEAMMKPGTTMVPRVFKTNVGDIFTTNCIMGDPAVGATLTPNAQGYLAAGTGDMQWQVVKKYDLADGQKAVKLMRIA